MCQYTVEVQFSLVWAIGRTRVGGCVCRAKFAWSGRVVSGGIGDGYHVLSEVVNEVCMCSDTRITGGSVWGCIVGLWDCFGGGSRLILQWLWSAARSSWVTV